MVKRIEPENVAVSTPVSVNLMSSGVISVGKLTILTSTSSIVPLSVFKSASFTVTFTILEQLYQLLSKYTPPLLPIPKPPVITSANGCGPSGTLYPVTVTVYAPTEGVCINTLSTTLRLSEFVYIPSGPVTTKFKSFTRFTATAGVDG